MPSPQFPTDTDTDSELLSKITNNTSILAGTPPTGGGGTAGVTKIIAGSNVTVTPSGGTGDVTVSSTGGGGGAVTQIIAGTGISVTPSGGTGAVTVTNTGGVGGVSSVNGKTGAVTLASSDIGLGSVTNDAQVKRTEMAVANGVATLGSDGKVPSAQLPTGTFPVTSVAGRTGDVVLTKSDVGLANVDNTSDVNKPVSTAQAAADATTLSSANSHSDAHASRTDNPHSVTQTQVGLSAVTNDAQVKRTEMGVANGVATLDVTGKVPSAQLPSSSGGVTSVNTRTGAVTLSSTDVGVSAGQLAALAGTSGSPGSGNKYVTAAGLVAVGAKFDVVAAYNGSGCGTQTTGSITTGTNSLVVASATTFAVGQGIFVLGAGASGANLVTTITAISGTTFTLASNAGTTVSSVRVQHDDTAAINAAISAAYTNGGGLVYLTKAGTADLTGIYRCNGNFDSTTNGIITFPVNLTYTTFPLKIQMVGECRGTLNGTIVFTANVLTSIAPTAIVSGVCIDSTDAPTGTGNYPAMIATAPWNNTPGSTQFNNVDTFFDSFALVAPPNPTFGGLRASNSLNATVGDGLLATTLSTTSLYIQPTHSAAVGVYMPEVFNHAVTAVGQIYSYGWYTGLIVSEHARLDRPCIACCVEGLRLSAGSALGHMISGTVSIEDCTKLIVQSSSQAMPLNLALEGEIALDGSWWSTVDGGGFYGTNGVYGELRYEIFKNAQPVYLPSNGTTALKYTALNDSLITRPEAFVEYAFSDLTDSSGNGYTLSNHNSVTFTTGKVGNAAVFNGTNQYLSAPAPGTALKNAGDYTICGWFNATSLPVAQACLCGQSDAYPARSFFIFLKSDGTIWALVYTGSGGTPTNVSLFSSAVTTGTWHFVCLELCSTYHQVRLSLDGGHWQTIATGNSLAVTTTNGLTFGCDTGAAGGSAENFFNGMLDAWRVYARILTREELLVLYNGGNGIE